MSSAPARPLQTATHDRITAWPPVRCTGWAASLFRGANIMRNFTFKMTVDKNGYNNPYYFIDGN